MTVRLFKWWLLAAVPLIAGGAVDAWWGWLLLGFGGLNFGRMVARLFDDGYAQAMADVADVHGQLLERVEAQREVARWQ